MKIAIACDHGALELKEYLTTLLTELGHEVKDFGTHTLERCNYPEIITPAVRAVAAGGYERGIVRCTTGIGVSIAANKIRGIRCALCTGVWQAEMTRRHNDSNVLALGAGITGPNLAAEIVKTWLSTGFDGGRHATRVGMLTELDEER